MNTKKDDQQTSGEAPIQALRGVQEKDRASRAKLFISAFEMARVTLSSQRERAKEGIDQAAMAGRNITELHFILDEAHVKDLTDLGYSVMRWEEQDRTTISWA